MAAKKKDDKNKVSKSMERKISIDWTLDKCEKRNIRYTKAGIKYDEINEGIPKSPQGEEFKTFYIHNTNKNIDSERYYNVFNLKDRIVSLKSKILNEFVNHNKNFEEAKRSIKELDKLKSNKFKTWQDFLLFLVDPMSLGRYYDIYQQTIKLIQENFYNVRQTDVTQVQFKVVEGARYKEETLHLSQGKTNKKRNIINQIASGMRNFNDFALLLKTQGDLINSIKNSNRTGMLKTLIVKHGDKMIENFNTFASVDWNRVADELMNNEAIIKSNEWKKIFTVLEAPKSTIVLGLLKEEQYKLIEDKTTDMVAQNFIGRISGAEKLSDIRKRMSGISTKNKKIKNEIINLEHIGNLNDSSDIIIKVAITTTDDEVIEYKLPIQIKLGSFKADKIFGGNIGKEKSSLTNFSNKQIFRSSKQITTLTKEQPDKESLILASANAYLTGYISSNGTNSSFSKGFWNYCITYFALLDVYKYFKENNERGENKEGHLPYIDIVGGKIIILPDEWKKMFNKPVFDYIDFPRTEMAYAQAFNFNYNKWFSAKMAFKGTENFIENFVKGFENFDDIPKNKDPNAKWGTHGFNTYKYKNAAVEAYKEMEDTIKSIKKRSVYHALRSMG